MYLCCNERWILISASSCRNGRRHDGGERGGGELTCTRAGAYAGLDAYAYENAYVGAAQRGAVRQARLRPTPAATRLLLGARLVQRLLVDNLASNNLVLLSKCKLEAAREAALLGGFGVGGWAQG